MSVETAIWKMTAQGPVRLEFTSLGLEATLEDMLAADPSMVGLDLLVVGRQVATAHGGFVDILGLDSDAQIHVIELKRDRTPRDVVAQTLDYGSWASGLTLERVSALYAEHQSDTDIEDAFAETFSQPLPDVFNLDQRLTIVASELDPASDRIVEYLATQYAVPINAVFFRHFTDGGNEYLTRTWLLTPEEAAGSSALRHRPARRRPWNGRDFYVIQGSVSGDRNDRWELARRYGLLSAGGGTWYWRPLRNLTPGKRVFAYVGGVGYVGVGRVTGEMRPARETNVEVDGETVNLLDAPEVSSRLVERGQSDDPEETEMVVPVQWDVAVSQAEAVNEAGLFASQVTVCKLRDQRTIDVVTQRFGLQDGEGDQSADPGENR